MLQIRDLYAKTDSTEILNGVDLTINPGEVHVLMGPNGSGKSTLAKVVMGHPSYEVSSGTIQFENKDLLSLEPDERARLGIYTAFQYPVEVPGVSFRSYLRLAYNSSRSKNEQLPVYKFRQELLKKAQLLEMNKELLDRNLNEDLSGGEKKMTEILQLAVLEPKLAILDETDSGLDIDSLKSVFKGIARIKKQKPDMAILIITHYHKIFEYIEPQFVHIIKKGKILADGGKELLTKIASEGYKVYESQVN